MNGSQREVRFGFIGYEVYNKLRFQKNVNTAFTAMHEFKTTKIVNITNDTPVIVKTTNTETDTTNNIEITQNPYQWITDENFIVYWTMLVCSFIVLCTLSFYEW